MSTTSQPRRVDHALDYLRADDFPEPAHVLAVRKLMLERGYTRAAVDEVVGIINAFGSVWCAEQFDGFEEDRRDVERILPGHANDFPAWTEAFRWELGPEA
jgi:hypothetical protein